MANHSTDLIIHKIKELVSSYKEAHQIKRQTGQSTEAVYAACRYFDLLNPILGSRPSIKPLPMNKDLIDGKIVAKSRAKMNTSSPASSMLSEDIVVAEKLTTVVTAPISASASAKKNSKFAVAKGKTRKMKSSEKVCEFYSY